MYKNASKTMNINLEYYKVFYYVCTEGSLTAAAQKLCISQPAVSQAVRQLEKEAGTRLFLRTSKGIRLTREGELLFRYVKTGVEQLLEGGRMLERMLDMDMGEVRIGASDMTLQFFLLPFLEQFHKEYPRIKVTVTNAPTPETICSLEEGKIDFGVVTTPFSCKSTIHSMMVKPIGTVFMPCIFLEKNTSTRAFMDAFLSAKGMELTPEFELATSDMIVQFAKRNMGVGCVMDGFAKDAIAKGEVFELDFKEKMPLRHICVVTGENSLISLAGRKLLNLFDEMAESSYMV